SQPGAIEVQGKEVSVGTLLFETVDALGSEPHEDNALGETKDGIRRLGLNENMLTFPGLSIEGRVPISTGQLCPQVIGHALAAEKYAAEFFGNGAVPTGILTLPNVMEEKSMEELKRQWAEAHGGENAHKVAALHGGLKYEKMQNNPDEAQLLETRK